MTPAIRGRGQRTVTWQGDIDIATITPLLAELDLVLRDTTTVWLTLDLAAVSFLDSIGIGTLLDARHQAMDRAVTFEVRHASPKIARLLDACGVSQVLNLV